MPLLDQQQRLQQPNEQQQLDAKEVLDIERFDGDDVRTVVELVDEQKENTKFVVQNDQGENAKLLEDQGHKVKCDPFFDIKHVEAINDEVISVNGGELEQQPCEKTTGRIVRKTIGTTKAWVVCSFVQLPRWLQDNEFLHISHRPQLPSFKQCFRSIFRMHSETGNIWSHLIGCLMFVVMAVYVVFTLPPNMYIIDKVMFGIFFLGAILCLAFSFIFHTVCCHSSKIGKLFNKLDYCGISLLITGSFVSCIYYMFYCDPTKRLVYLVSISLLCVSTIVVSLMDRFSQPNFRTIRASVFIVFGCSGLIPTLHWFILSEWSTIHALTVSFIFLISMGVLYVLGGVLYAGRIPERFWPGKCDYWFQSHQIFHILVIVAAILDYQGLRRMATYRLSYTCDNVPIIGTSDEVSNADFFSFFG